MKGFKWKDNSSNDPSVIEHWFQRYPDCNWALDCEKSGVAVVDLDLVVPSKENNYKSEDGLQTLSAMAEITPPYRLTDTGDKDGLLMGVLDLLNSPRTLVYATPRGGIHILYKGVIKNSSRTIGPGIDTRGTGGYIVINPSVFQGKEYSVLYRDKIAELPLFFVEKLNAGKEKPKTEIVKSDSSNMQIPANTDIDDFQESEEAVQSVMSYLQKAEKAEQGSGGDALTLQTAYRVRDMGISENMAFTLMCSFWNPNCTPPWSPQELRTKVKNAYVYAENPLGSESPAVIFKDYIKPLSGNSDVGITTTQQNQILTEPKTENKKGIPNLRDRIKTFKYFVETKAPEMEWLIDGWIPEQQNTLITGAPGMGKSLIAFELAASVAYGKPWFGMTPKKIRPVITVMCEDSEDELHRRANTIGNHKIYESLIPDGEMFNIVSQFGYDSQLCHLKNNILSPAPFLQGLVRLLEEPFYQGSKPFVILDTVTDVFGHNENDTGLVNQFIKKILGGLIKRFECTFLIIGHPPKNTESEYAGSIKWEAGVRSRIYVSRFSDDKTRFPGYRIMTKSKSNYSIEGTEIKMKYNNGIYSLMIDEPTDKTEEADLNMLLGKISELAEKGTPISMAHQSTQYLKYVYVQNNKGKEIVWEEKKRLVAKLMLTDRIKDIKGRSQGNGIYPYSAE